MKKEKLVKYQDGVVHRTHNRRVAVTESLQFPGSAVLRIWHVGKDKNISKNETIVFSEVLKGRIKHTQLLISEEGLDSIITALMTFKENFGTTTFIHSGIE